tara:strand:- start:101 stop:862 length:762 start_codon:yes stop_codon:yes gene_type:complete
MLGVKMYELNHTPNGYIFPTRKIQTTIIDPPYNINYKYKSTFKDKFSDSEYESFIFNVLQKTYKHSLDSSSLFLINYPENFLKYANSILDSDWNLHQVITWVYSNNAGFAKKRFTKASRNIVWLTKDEPYVDIKAVQQDFKNPTDKRIKKKIDAGIKGTNLYSWWEINIVKFNARECLGYVNQIPFELLKRLILTTSKKNDLVYDPMCGSGSTIFAADVLGRDGFGCDINEDCQKIWEDVKKGIKKYEVDVSD